MKKLEIQIRSVGQVLEDFKEAFKAAQEGKPFPKREGVFFTSLEAARNLLTPERVKLLRLIRQRKPDSLYELAQLAGRDLKNVHEDIELLERHGILRTTLRRQLERPRRIPEVQYDEILVHIPLSVREAEGNSQASDLSANELSLDFPDYESWRLKYKPETIRWLFVAESPPSDPTRFFYFEHVTRADSLFLELMKALYPTHSTTAKKVRSDKRAFLERFRKDGCYLVDVVEYPLGEIGSAGKARKLQEALPRLIKRLQSLAERDTKVVLISVPVFKVCSDELRHSGLRIINDGPVDFPGSGRQRKFQSKMRELLLLNGWQST